MVTLFSFSLYVSLYPLAYCLMCNQIAWQITPLPGAWPQKPGSATFPFFGVQVCDLYRLSSMLHCPLDICL